MDRKTPKTSARALAQQDTLPGWLLPAIFLAAAALIYGLLGANGTAAAYGLAQESPPHSPLPSPLDGPPDVDSLSPDEGEVGQVHTVNIYDEHTNDNQTGPGDYRPQSRAFLVYAGERPPDGQTGAVPENAVLLPTNFINSRQLAVKIPADLRKGVYDVGVVNPNGQPGILRNGYFAFKAEATDSTDLTSRSQALWTNPNTVFADEQIALGLQVQRKGEKGGTLPVTVAFFQEKIKPQNLIGRGVIPLMAPNSKESTSPVLFTPDSPGELKIIAVIDPQGQIAESNEDNNVIVRTLQVRLVRTEDTTPPVAESLAVNDGVHRVSERDVQISVQAHDPGDPSSGVGAAKLIELHPLRVPGVGAIWIPVKWTDWLPFAAQPYDVSLHPIPGIRYMQAWVVDRAGNVANSPALQRIGYVPADDSLLAGENRIYRETVQANQCLQVTVSPTGAQMDADLYVWSPGYTPGSGNFVYSINPAGQIDAVTVQPTAAGTYQIEVEALTDVSYQLNIQVANSCARGKDAQPSATDAKTPRAEPLIPVDHAPEAEDNSAPTGPVEYLVFIANLGRETRSKDTSVNVYLPALNP